MLFANCKLNTNPQLTEVEETTKSCSPGKCHYHYKYTYKIDCYYDSDMKRVCDRVKVLSGKIWVCHSIPGGL